MKLKIKSLGPLTDTELDLGDLTVLFGFPSSGKSYILKAIYSRMAFLDEANNYEFANLITRKFVEDLEKKALAGEREFTVNLINPFLTVMEELVNLYAKFFFTSFNVELEGLEGVKDVVSDELKRVVTREKTFMPYSQEVAVSVTYDRGIMGIKAKGKSNHEISYYLPIALNEYLSTMVIPSVMALASEKYGKVKYIPFGREVILLLRPKKVTRQYRSLAYWLEKGIDTLMEKSIADEIFNVRISVTKSQGISVNGFPVHMTSSSWNEISLLDLLVHGVRDNILLIEEPESQLNPILQLNMALYLYSIAQENRVVITTHSDYIIDILSMLAKFKNKAIDLLEKNITPFRHEKVLDIKFYLVDNGKVKEYTADELMNEMPIITKLNLDIIKLKSELL